MIEIRHDQLIIINKYDWTLGQRNFDQDISKNSPVKHQLTRSCDTLITRKDWYTTPNA